MIKEKVNYLAVPIELNGHHYDQLKPFHALFGGVQMLARRDQSTFNLFTLMHTEAAEAMNNRHAASRGVADWVQRFNSSFNNIYSTMQFEVRPGLTVSDLMNEDPRYVCEELGKVKGLHPLVASPLFDRTGRVASLFRTLFMGNAQKLHAEMKGRQ